MDNPRTIQEELEAAARSDLMRLRAAASGRPISTPATCPPTCPVCGGIGFIRYNAPLGHELFGRIFPCPRTPRGDRHVRTPSGLFLDELDTLTWSAIQPWNLSAVWRGQVKETTLAQIGEAVRKHLQPAAVPAEAQPDPPQQPAPGQILYPDRRGVDHPAEKREAQPDRRGADHPAERAQLYPEPAATPPAAGFVFLYGSAGVGKSRLLKTAVAEQLRLGRWALYIQLADLLENLKQGFDHKDGKANAGGGRERGYERIETYLEHPFLAVDEVDKVQDTDWSAGILFRLVDARYEAAVHGGGATLLAGNLGPDMLGGALESRLLDGRCLTIQLRGEDARQKMGRKA